MGEEEFLVRLQKIHVTPLLVQDGWNPALQRLRKALVHVGKHTCAMRHSHYSHHLAFIVVLPALCCIYLFATYFCLLEIFDILSSKSEWRNLDNNVDCDQCPVVALMWMSLKSTEKGLGEREWQKSCSWDHFLTSCWFVMSGLFTKAHPIISLFFFSLVKASFHFPGTVNQFLPLSAVSPLFSSVSDCGGDLLKVVEFSVWTLWPCGGLTRQLGIKDQLRNLVRKAGEDAGARMPRFTSLCSCIKSAFR